MRAWDLEKSGFFFYIWGKAGRRAVWARLEGAFLLADLAGSKNRGKSVENLPGWNDPEAVFTKLALLSKNKRLDAGNIQIFTLPNHKSKNKEKNKIHTI